MEVSDTSKKIVEDITAILDEFEIPLWLWEHSSYPIVNAYFFGMSCKKNGVNLVACESNPQWSNNPLFSMAYRKGIEFQQNNNTDPTAKLKEEVYYGLVSEKVEREHKRERE
jgi:hypothetical protein